MSAAGSCRRLRLHLLELLSSPLGAAAAAAFVAGRTGNRDFMRRKGESSSPLVCHCGTFVSSISLLSLTIPAAKVTFVGSSVAK
ncbi:hypothetical protein Drorol1_Dr00008497, partial [Drosera rotundifolia]